MFTFKTDLIKYVHSTFPRKCSVRTQLAITTGIQYTRLKTNDADNFKIYN
jgi:hypothetical protein